MNFEKLLDNNKIEKIEKTDFDSESAEKDLEFAKNGMVTENYSRVMAVAYEAILRIGNRVLNFLGYRAIGKDHHKNTFEFLRECNINDSLTDFFDKIRVKRNNFVYRDVENISKKETEEVLNNADKLVQEIRTFVLKIRTGDKEGTGR